MVTITRQKKKDIAFRHTSRKQQQFCIRVTLHNIWPDYAFIFEGENIVNANLVLKLPAGAFSGDEGDKGTCYAII